MNIATTNIILIVVLIAVMYFVMIRPQQKQEKKNKEMRESLKIGDEIVTIGGIVGKIVRITNDTIIFETSEDRVRIEVAKWAISTTGVQTEEQPVEKKEKKKAAEVPEEPEAPSAEKSDEQ